MYKRMEAYFKKNPNYNAAVHAMIGVGLGILITYPLIREHPVRWGVAFIIAGLLGHLYPIIKGRG